MNLDSYVTFEKLINHVNDTSNIKIEIDTHSTRHVGIKMVNKRFPVSINEAEFNFMKNIIQEYNLKNAYELATGVGISTIAIGYGIKQVDGFFMTADSYCEENILTEPTFNHKHKNYENSEGYILVLNMLKEFGLENHVFVKKGWSPEDTVPELKKLFLDKGKKLNFVFFDCPKNDIDFEKEIKTIKPFLDEKFVMCFHDTHPYSSKSDNLLIRLFGRTFTRVRKYDFGNGIDRRHFCLGVLTNIDKLNNELKNME